MARTFPIYISTASATTGAESLTGDAIARVDLKIGAYRQSPAVHVSGTTSVNLTSSTDVMTINDVKTGKSRSAPKDINRAVSQATSSPISGCDSHLVPNYGDGASSIKTTWPDDNSYSATSGYRVMLVGGKPVNSVYDRL